MQRITREHARKYAFDWRDEPILRVSRGETVEIETYDASTGYFKTVNDEAIPARRPGCPGIPPPRSRMRSTQRSPVLIRGTAIPIFMRTL